MCSSEDILNNLEGIEKEKNPEAKIKEKNETRKEQNARHKHKNIRT